MIAQKIHSERVTFTGSGGAPPAGRLELPNGPVHRTLTSEIIVE